MEDITKFTDVAVCDKHNYAYLTKDGKSVIGCIECKKENRKKLCQTK